MILRGGQHAHRLAIGQDEQAGFRPFQALFHHHRAMDFGQRGEAFLVALGHRHALAAGQAIGLHDDGQRVNGDIMMGIGRTGEAPEAGGGNVIFGAQILGETLGGFQFRRCGGRPNHRHTGAAQRIGDASDQRRFRADDHQRDAIGRDEIHHGLGVGHVQRHATRHLGNAGIARRAQQPPAAR